MENVLRLTLDSVDTPIGELLLATDVAGNLRATDWREYEDRMRRLLRLHYGARGFSLERGSNPGIADAIRRYFAGQLEAIDRLPVETAGTSFQRQVWHALRKVTCGTTICYAELAERVGRPAAVRAVGMANGANPVGVVVPCHRVIGANGALTGYGGGIERKRWLLRHERALL